MQKTIFTMETTTPGGYPTLENMPEYIQKYARKVHREYKKTVNRDAVSIIKFGPNAPLFKKLSEEDQKFVKDFLFKKLIEKVPSRHRGSVLSYLSQQRGAKSRLLKEQREREEMLFLGLAQELTGLGGESFELGIAYYDAYELGPKIPSGVYRVAA